MDYNAVNTKIQAMRGNLLKPEDYRELSRLGSVSDVAAELREKPGYSELMYGMDISNIHRDELERKLRLSLYHDYIDIKRFLYEKPLSDYFSAIYLRYQFNFLELLLSTVFDERTVPYTIPEMNLLLGREFKADPAKLTASKTVPEFIEHLKETNLYTLLANAYEKSPSLFSLESQLDLHYYTQLWKKQKTLLDKENQEVMCRIKGTEIDLRNIIWIYRLKQYYHMDDDRVFAYLIPENYKLKAMAARKMALSGDGGELLDDIAAGPYKNVFKNFDKPELSFYRAMLKCYRLEIKSHPKSLAIATGYIFEKELETENITAVLEGVRYGLGPDEIMEYICF